MKHTLRYLGLSGILVAPIAMGAGFQLNEFSVTAMGRAQAGEPAMSDTAASMARNPAAMGGFDSDSVSAVVHYIDPDINVEGTNTGGFNADAQDVAPEATVPGLYYIHPVDDKLAVGLSLNSYYGLATDYGDHYAASEFAKETSIETYYLTPTISYKPVDNVTLGLGIHYIYGKGKITSETSPSVTAVTQASPAITNATPPGVTALDLDGSGDAFGYQVGVKWEITRTTRLGFRYQSRVDLDLEGDMTLFVPYQESNPSATPPFPNAGSPQDFTGTLTVNLPEVYELGLVHQQTDRLTIMMGLQKTGWHRFKDLTAKVDGAGSKKLKDEDWQDAWRYSIGAEYKAIPNLTLRAGYGLDESPVKEDKRTLTIPDADRQWFSFGGSYDLESLGSIDVAYLYIDGSSVDVNETSNFGTTFDGKLTSTDASIFSVGYNYTF